MLLAFPWLFVPFGLYNAIAFARAGASSLQELFNTVIVSTPMISGAVWQVSAGEGIVAITLIFQSLDILRVTRSGSISLVDHALSTALFALCLVEFIVRREAATSVFFLITLTAFANALIGLSLSIGPRLRYPHAPSKR